MTKGPNRINLDTYLDTALGGHVQVVGRDWKRKAQDLQTLSDALKLAAGQAELRIGEQTLTGPALRAGMERSSTSMSEKADTLRTAGEALVTVGQQINDTKDARDAMADLGPKPAAYQAPAGTPGVEPTPEELQAQAQAAQARQSERNAWQTEYDKQEARSLALTKELDGAFLGAIPPMKEIHGQDDPTEPTDDVPSGPGGPYLPGTQAPATTGGGAGGGNKSDQGFYLDSSTAHGTEVTPTTTNTTNPTTPTVPPTQPPTHPITVPTVSTETTTVSGSQQSGVTYQGPQVSAPTSSGGAGGAGGMNAAAFGAAGAAGGASGMMGGGRAASASAGSAPTRPIGATGRSASAGALSRTPASSSGSAAARSGAAGSQTSRGAAGAAGARGAAGAAGSAGGRGGAGSAGGRGAASGSTAGSRSGGRGSSGARSAGVGGAAGRGGRTGDRDEAQERGSLVYDQDWLGDDDVAPGVLD